MNKGLRRFEVHEYISAGAAFLSALAAIVAATFSAESSKTARDALQSNERLSIETERSSLFGQFQEQYNGVSSRFPKRLLDRSFRPPRGSDDYARLESYWFFCFSEWYETTRVNPKAYQDLWRNYYTPLIADGLEVPSLRYALEDRIRSRGPGKGEWHSYLRELATIAKDYDKPLSRDAQRKLDLQQ